MKSYSSVTWLMRLEPKRKYAKNILENKSKFFCNLILKVGRNIRTLKKKVLRHRIRKRIFVRCRLIVFVLRETDVKLEFKRIVTKKKFFHSDITMNVYIFLVINRILMNFF
ncbi:hypothetical protein RCL_jg733.t2 [Rhizophagus clarus]|uniref:Uncharacterized protein n=1 Tax=Rhizophagus clarus TaxID=94130 RepID=A0A8H3QL84_9GLOM|nr:hypothetical protein RCL_jg733.t2 [Rhizophagus clarus]